MKLLRGLLIASTVAVLANANMLEIKLHLAPALIDNVVFKKFSDIKYIYSAEKKELFSLYFNTNKVYDFSNFIPFRDSEFKKMIIKEDGFYLVKR